MTVTPASKRSALARRTNRQFRRARLAALVGAFCLLPSLVLLADRHDSPIRTSLPGFLSPTLEQQRLPIPDPTPPQPKQAQTETPAPVKTSLPAPLIEFTPEISEPITNGLSEQSNSIELSLEPPPVAKETGMTLPLLSASVPPKVDNTPAPVLKNVNTVFDRNLFDESVRKQVIALREQHKPLPKQIVPPARPVVQTATKHPVTPFDARRYEISIRMQLHRTAIQHYQKQQPRQRKTAPPTDSQSRVRQVSGHGDPWIPVPTNEPEITTAQGFEPIPVQKESPALNMLQNNRANAIADFYRPLTKAAQETRQAPAPTAQTPPATEQHRSVFSPAVFTTKKQNTNAALASARLDRLGVKHYQSSQLGSEPPAHAGYFSTDFSPTCVDPLSLQIDSTRESWIYDGKYSGPTQRPWVEWPRQFYGPGITPRGRNLWGDKNLYRPEFYVYGDYRTGVLSGRNANGRVQNWAHRLNLDFDFRVTDTERIHLFIGPLDENGQFTRVERVDGDLDLELEVDFTPVTGFFEGDLGVILSNQFNRPSQFELPITFGLVPLLFQNGIWAEDAISGLAFSLPARHSTLLNISNADLTFFAGFDQINSPAFNSDHAAQVFGTAWFIEAYDGYIEAGYAYLRDRNFSERSYHNATISYTRRYFDRVSNSLRVIVNDGQSLPSDDRTADGVLLLVENSLITAAPLTVVPYLNFFVGWDRPQSVARAAGSGGILRNTGINFDTDGLNGYPTLDATGSDTAGFSLGIDLLGQGLDRQLVLETSFLTTHGSKNTNIDGDQFGIGSRFQIPLSHATIFRADAMYGWREGQEDLHGTRVEFRWKF